MDFYRRWEGVLDPDACRGWVIARWHPEGPRCHDCGSALGERQARTFAAGGRVRCNACRRWFTYRAGTPAAGSVVSDRVVVLVALLSDAGCAPAAIASACGLGVDTVRAWQRRLAGAP